MLEESEGRRPAGQPGPRPTRPGHPDLRQRQRHRPQARASWPSSPAASSYEAKAARTSSWWTWTGRSSKAGSGRPPTRRRTWPSTGPSPRSAASPTPTARRPRPSPRPGRQIPCLGTTHADHFNGPGPRHPLPDAKRSRRRLRDRTPARSSSSASPSSTRWKCRPSSSPATGPSPGAGRRPRPSATPSSWRLVASMALADAAHQSPGPPPCPRTSCANTISASTARRPITDKRKEQLMNNIPAVKLGLVAVSRDCFPIELSRNAAGITLAEACRKKAHPHRRDPDHRRKREGRPEGPGRAQGRRRQRPGRLPRQLRARRADDHPGPALRRPGHVRRRGRGDGQGPDQRPRRRLLRHAQRLLQHRPAQAPPLHPRISGRHARRDRRR